MIQFLYHNHRQENYEVPDFEKDFEHLYIVAKYRNTNN